MRTFEDNGIILTVPNLYTPILGVAAWQQKCSLSGSLPTGAWADWIEHLESGGARSATRGATLSYYLMGLLPTNAAEPEFRQFTIELECYVYSADMEDTLAHFSSIEINLCYGSVQRNVNYFNFYPYSFAWKDMEFAFSAPFTFSHKIQYGELESESMSSMTYPDAAMAGYVPNALGASPLCAHRITGEQGSVADINTGGRNLFDVEGLRYNAANAELIPARYTERTYRGRGGVTETVSGGGYAFFEIKTSTIADPTRVSVATLEDWNYALPLIVGFDSEWLRLEGEVLNPDTGEWEEDENCYISLTSHIVGVGGKQYYLYELRNLSADSHYWLLTEGRGTSMIFSEQTGEYRFSYIRYTLRYIADEVVENVDEVIEGSGGFLPLARRDGVIVDLGACPDLTLKWLDEAGYVWSLPFFYEKIEGAISDKSDAIPISATNRLVLYGGEITLNLVSPVMTPAELHAARSITRSIFYSAAGRALEQSNYSVIPGFWYYVEVNSITYEWTKAGGRIALAIKGINTNDVDAIGRQMYVQNIAE